MSPSASVDVAVQVRVSETVGVVGVTVTEVTSGAVFSAVTESATGVPVSVPSSGVTVQVMASPDAKAPAARVLPVPAAVPLTVQA